MSRIGKLALVGIAMTLSAPHAQAANIDAPTRAAAPMPLIDAPVNSSSLAGEAQQRRGGHGTRSGGGRSFRGGGRGFSGGYRGSNRGYRSGGRNFGNRNVYRGNRGYRGGRNVYRGNRGRYDRRRYSREYRGRNFGLGLAAGVFLGSALGYPSYSSYGYPTYGYPAYGYPSYGFYGGYERCRYRGRYYDASFCYNFPYGYRREYYRGHGPEGHSHRHYHGRHCDHDRRHHGYYRDY